VARLLIEHGDVELDAKKDTYGWTRLSLAAVNGHEAVVRLLIERERVELDSKDRSSRTPLLLAVVDCHDIAVQLLLEKGVNVNRQHDFYGNVQQAAAYHGREMVVHLLMAYGADCHQLDEHGRNALHVAARGGNLNVVNYLLDRGLDFSVRGKRGDMMSEILEYHRRRKQVELGNTDGENGQENDVVAIYGHYGLLQVSTYSCLYKP
jgi:ankyrin repeat protein